MTRAAPAAPDDIAAANGDGVAHHRVCQLSRRIRRRHALDDGAAVAVADPDLVSHGQVVGVKPVGHARATQGEGGDGAVDAELGRVVGGHLDRTGREAGGK